MYLTHLSLTNFRNFTRLDVDLPAGRLVLVGDNAQGKTSLLEAVYYLAALDSFLADNDRQLLNFIAAREPLAVARLVADFCHSGSQRRLEVRLIQESSRLNGGVRLRKEALLDGVKHKVGEVVGRFNAVLFTPQMMRTIEGPPEERRRYLNLTLAQAVAFYHDALAEYNRALTQRNALLKQLADRQGDPAQLDFWDLQLATLGAQLVHSRIQALQELERPAARIHKELTRGAEVLRLSYQPAYDPLPRAPGQYTLPLDAAVDRSSFSVEQIRQGFLERLAVLRFEEIQRGMTTLGPHRDELRFLGNGVDLGVYGSRGQVRTAMLSVKLAEVEWLKDNTGQWPVLLLDEVLAELDEHRRLDLLSHLAGSEQMLLTTTGLDLFSPEFTGQAAVWRVQAGRLELP